jgi:hypothetical protein
VMAGFTSLRWVGSAVALAALLTACGGSGGEASTGMAPQRSGPVVPVETSVVGLGPSGSAGTTSAPTTTVATRATAPTTAAANFGESQSPITLPSTPAPAVDEAVKPAVETVARSFLERYWAPSARTSAQVADELAPFATDRLLALYRSPNEADRSIPGAGVGAITVLTTAASPTTATVTGRGTLAATPDQPPAYRTLTLVVGPDGAWRVDRVS